MGKVSGHRARPHGVHTSYLQAAFKGQNVQGRGGRGTGKGRVIILIVHVVSRHETEMVFHLITPVSSALGGIVNIDLIRGELTRNSVNGVVGHLHNVSFGHNNRGDAVVMKVIVAVVSVKVVKTITTSAVLRGCACCSN